MIYDTGRTQIDVRAARPADKLPILNIDLKSYELDWPDEKWKIALNSTLVAQLSTTSRVVGMCHASLVPATGMLKIIRFAVTPLYRRHLIGTSMLAQLIKLNKNCSAVSALVGESQEAARAFLEKHGFNVTAETENYPVTGGTEVGYLYEATLQ